jgi:hypothetical protein
VPGRNPISRSFAERVSSEKPEITAVSPGFIPATFLFNSTSLFRLILNNANIGLQVELNNDYIQVMKKKGAKPKKVKKTEKNSEPPQPENEDQFDFGGLPKRDLKKNLGCG